MRYVSASSYNSIIILPQADRQNWTTSQAFSWFKLFSEKKHRKL